MPGWFTPLILSFLLLNALGAAGCATAISGSHDRIHIRSQDGAPVVVNGQALERGEGAIWVQRDGGPIMLSLQGSDGSSAIHLIQRRLDPWVFANLANPWFWAVDLVSGNAWEPERTCVLIPASQGKAAASGATDCGLDAPSEVNPWAQKTYVWGGGGAASPVGILGVGLGRLGDEWGFEFGYGLGATGHQLSTQILRAWHLSRHASLVLATGPSVALAGDKVGLEVAHRLDRDVTDKVFYASWLNTGLSLDFHGNTGAFFRVGLGLFVTLAENMSPLCEGVEYDDIEAPANNGCAPPHFESGPEFTRKRVGPYVNIAFGYAF